MPNGEIGGLAGGERGVRSRGKIAVLVLMLLFLSAVVFGAYYFFVDVPRAPYRAAGLSDAQHSSFVRVYPQENGNSSWVDFARVWSADFSLANQALYVFGSLEDSLSYLNLYSSQPSQSCSLQ